MTGRRENVKRQKYVKNKKELITEGDVTSETAERAKKGDQLRVGHEVELKILHQK